MIRFTKGVRKIQPMCQKKCSMVAKGTTNALWGRRELPRRGKRSPGEHKGRGQSKNLEGGSQAGGRRGRENILKKKKKLGGS